MAFSLYTQLFQYIDNRVVHFATEKSAAVAMAIEPFAVASAGIFLMIQGYRHMMGQVEQPFSEFMRMAMRIGIVLTVALSAGEYNTLIIDTFQNWPMVLADVLAIKEQGATPSLTNGIGATLDGMMAGSLEIGMSFWDGAGISAPGGYLVGLVVWIIGGLVTLVTAYLIVLSKMATALIGAIGPLFILAVLFESTKNFFNGFINAMANYGLVIVLAVANATLILDLYKQVAMELAALGDGCQVVDVAGLFITGGIGFLITLQVPSIAASLAGGLALHDGGFGQKLMRGTWRGITSPGRRGRENQRKARDEVDVAKRRGKIEINNKRREEERQVRKQRRQRNAITRAG